MALYRGWALEAMQTAGDNAALQSDATVPPSSFTAINRPAPNQLLTPQPSASSPPTGPTQANRGKPRNPAVAHYLGLGTEAEPPHVENCTPALLPTPPPPARGRKRNRKKQDEDNPVKGETGKTKAPQQRRVSDGLRVTKPVSRKSARKNNAANSSRPSNPQDVLYSPYILSNVALDQLASARPNLSAGGGAQAPPKQVTVATNQNVPTPSANRFSVSNSSVVSDTSTVHPAVGHSSQETIADDEFDDIFNSIDFDHFTNSPSTDIQPEDHPEVPHQRDPEAGGVRHSFRGRPEDKGLLHNSPVRSAAPKQGNAAAHPPASTDTACSPDSLQTSKPRGPTRQFISPLTPKTHQLIEKVKAGYSRDRKPIVRSPFPAPARDRSPIVGLSSDLLLRTCFRVGEVINQASHATKHGQNVIFELYARVLRSSRNEARQHFVFCDLFHKNPPYIKATYDAAIWKQVRLYEVDSGRLLIEGRKCRCIGKMKRDGTEWVMVVLNIWEATWEDIAWVEGIVNS